MKINYKRTSKVFAITLTLAFLIVTTVYAAWNTSVIAVSSLDGSMADAFPMVVVNGKPAISYETGFTLKYVRAGDINGDTWSSPVSPDSAFGAGHDSSLAVVNGHPAISYRNSFDYNLNYVRADDADGNTWGSPVEVSDDDAYDTSLAIVDGYPAISYNYNGLKFVRANDVNGTSWGTPVTVDSIISSGGRNSLVVINGYPTISYYDYISDELKFVRASNVSGTAWNSPVTVAHVGNMGENFQSLAEVDGNPAISYFDNNAVEILKYVRANDPNGTTWGTPVVVEEGRNLGVSLAVIDGNPAISYCDLLNGELMYVRASDTSGTTWGSPSPIVLDSADAGARFTSLAVVNGHPAIGYLSPDSVFPWLLDLKFIRSDNPTAITLSDFGARSPGTQLHTATVFLGALTLCVVAVVVTRKRKSSE